MGKVVYNKASQGDAFPAAASRAVMAVFIVVFFISSVRGTFALHKLRSSADDAKNVSN